ncbi:MAG: glycosyltransferase [Synechococcaceae cyanobacterium]|nr:glycosyltransferase [Synechococcaceae cyanobacterium]
MLHLIPSIAPCRGGPSAAVLAMVTALRQDGVDAAIVSTDDDGPGRLDLPVGRWIEHRGVPVLLFPRWSPPLPPLREFAVAPALGTWLQQHLREWDLLHVHALFSWPSTWGMAVARRQRHPYLLRPIGQLQRWSLQRSPWRKRLFLAAIENANIRAASLLQATSPLEAEDLGHLALTSRIRVLPLGVPPQPPAAGPADPGHLLFLSRLHPKKRLEVLLEALALLQRREPSLPWRLSVAGSGDPEYVAGLQALATRLGLAQRCDWVGFVSGEAKRALLQSSGWFVLPSAAENFAIAAAEALAAGTPVILSPEVGIAAEVAAAGAGLICASEPEALARTLAAALRSSPTPYRAAARDLANRRYAWPAIATELRRIYTGLLTDPASPSKLR